jgi:hypothetical protein
VRCVGCEIDKSAESDYCECCGRRLSLSAMLRKGPGVFTTRQARDPERPDGREVERTAVRELEGAPAAEQSPALDGRCETCGAESPDGGLCPSCQQAFNAWLGNVETSTLSNAAAPCVAAATDDAAVASDAATVASEPTAVNDTTWVSSVTAASAATAVSEAPSAPEATPVEESLWSQLMNSPAPPPDDELYMPDPVEKAPARHKASSTSAVGVTATQTEAVSDELRSEVAPMEARAPAPVRTSEAVRTEEPTPPAAIPVDARIESTLPVNAHSPGVNPPRPSAPSSSQPKRRSVPLAAAAVVTDYRARRAAGAGGRERRDGGGQASTDSANSPGRTDSKSQASRITDARTYQANDSCGAGQRRSFIDSIDSSGRSRASSRTRTGGACASRRRAVCSGGGRQHSTPSSAFRPVFRDDGRGRVAAGDEARGASAARRAAEPPAQRNPRCASPRFAERPSVPH